MKVKYSNTSGKNTIKLIVEALLCILHNKPKIIKVYQFGINLLYLPVYELLDDVRTEWRNRLPNDPLNIIFSSHLTDEESCSAIAGANAWSSNSEATLELGVSEIPDDVRKKKILFESPFIKRLPLWGIALVNNPRINWFKKNSPNWVDKADWRQIAEERETRLHYWKAFSGKLSLLQAEDLTNAEVRLGVSIYHQGTTARRLFDKFIADENNLDRGKINFVSSVTVENEFDDLFHGIVDVALTVQPWEAVRQASRIRGHEVEIVYVHKGPPAPFSSVYALKPKDTEWWDRNLLELGINAISLGLQDKIAGLYNINSKENLNTYINLYQNVKNGFSLTAGDASHAQKTDSSIADTENMECALQVISDSRIYYFDMKNLSDNGHEKIVIEDLDNMLKQANETRYLMIEKISEVTDAIKSITTHVAKSDTLINHPDYIRLCELKTPESEYIDALEKLAQLYGFDFNKSWTCQEFMQKWRVENVKDILPNVCACASANDRWPPFNPWRDKRPEYPIWASKKQLVEAFGHFDSEFKAGEQQMFKATFISAGYISTNNNVIGFSWIWIEYKPTHNNNKQNIPIGETHFGDASSNIFGRGLLNACYLSKSENSPIKIDHFFKKIDHPEVTVTIDSQVKVGGMPVTYLLDYNEAKTGMQSTPRAMQAPHGLLVTFAVHAQERKAIL